MGRQDRGERLRQAIVEACRRLKEPSDTLKTGANCSVPGELYVFPTPVEAAIEWLVVRFHVDDTVGENVEADPEYMAWHDQVACARRSLEDRADAARRNPDA